LAGAVQLQAARGQGEALVVGEVVACDALAAGGVAC